MIINNIKMKNFRSYEDKTEFSFSPSGKQNIVLIGGENGAGKSTLFEAIKLCIYGPTSYGYIGSNSNYLNKIKNNINNNAFKNEVVDCTISISLSFNEGTQINEYTLSRSWEYVNQKIIEEFIVHKNGKLLNEEEVGFFNKFLQSELPPSLFDFFFFDGEELSEFFIGKNSSNSLKDAVLQLFNYDTFNILKKQLLSFQRSIAKQNAGFHSLQEDYDNALSRVKEIKLTISEIKESIVKNEEELDILMTQKNIMEEDFRNSGGILEAEKTAINAEINRLEGKRASTNQAIKDFCNEVLPFLMITDLLNDTKVQIESESNVSSYKNVSNKLSGDIIQKSLVDLEIALTNTSDYDKLAQNILNNMFNVSELNNINEILMLSPDQQSDIISLITSILNKSDSYGTTIMENFNKLRTIAESIKKLKDRLNSTISVDLVESYLRDLGVVNDKITLLTGEINKNHLALENNNDALRGAEYQYTRVKNQYTSSMQDNNVLDLSSNLTNYLDTLLSTLTIDKLKLIEDNFIDIFSTIIRKTDYVSSIVIEESFDSTLYISKSYSKMEIFNIITNLSENDVVKKYGYKFVEDLIKIYRVNTFGEFVDEFNTNPTFDVIDVRTKVNVNDFSKGEKQIYILCLIWALIKSSKVEVPFIIDTPYARIDETHRKSLTTSYLPNISKQVIILSTNEEIDSNLYKEIKPYICDEYLLLYNELARKTEVKKGYFEV